MGRRPCCSKEGVNRGAWTALEDKILTDYIKIHGEGRWRNLPKKAGHQTSTSPPPRNPLNMPKEKKNPTTRPSTTEPPPLPPMDSSVVRTKASRCTKVFLPSQPHKIEHDLDTSNMAVGPSMFGDLMEDKAPQDELPSFVAEEDNSLHLMVDLNIEDLCLYNFFDSGLSHQLCDFDNLSPSFDQPLLFSAEMMEDWTRSDCV
ncbi:hypothetical protein HHK36_005917 [Tetracentron sinense]|uniref:Myb-like domain-containing protein n=1 Tax=Tetracentron sinense TaxID=13715 RepID=A0A835D108_TETSI|nr:hypothetical protein HHK36_031822 [Tetracentron sinense]KAF8406796.1 hypothetical protein HHK36_005917 [Tetracentron sinense]